jgi:hypothetical protein
MMTEETFYQRVKSTLIEYSPEVPVEVYAGLRRKLWLNRFARLGLNRLNMLYILILGSVAAGILTFSGSEAFPAQKASNLRSVSPSGVSLDATNRAECVTVISDDIRSSCQNSQLNRRREVNSAPTNLSQDNQAGSAVQTVESMAVVGTNENGVVEVLDEQVAAEIAAPAAQPEVKKGKKLKVKVLKDKEPN